MTTIKEIRSDIASYFGREVTIAARYRRRHRPGGRRQWEAWFYSTAVTGLLIGIRYLKNGRVEWYEDHSEWYPDEGTIPAFLVVPGPYQNSVLVPVDALALKD